MSECKECSHWHAVNNGKKVKGYKDGKCGLGYRNHDDEACRIFRGKKEKVAEAPVIDEKAEAAKITGMPYGRFTSNPWKEWMKK